MVVSSSIALLAVAIAVLLVTGCHSSETPKSDIVVNAPASGVVRSILVGDGASIEKDAAIIEIAVTSQPTSPQKDHSDKAAIAARNDVVASEAEANRTRAELQRIEPLVKRGLASQAELDKARTQDQDAQARLARARDRVKAAEQQPNESTAVRNEEVVAVRAPAAGKVREINVLAGQQVTAGQALATLSSRS
jgi:multidrug efflux pump subunit AcrA (membrane-fusion protein)